jgi:hypothetical protein
MKKHISNKSKIIEKTTTVGEVLKSIFNGFSKKKKIVKKK